MRLIDADKIPWTDLSDGRGLCFVTFADKVNRMPTVRLNRIKRKSKKNKPEGYWTESAAWEYTRHDWRSVMLRLECSNCHKTTMVDGTIRYEYCPNCGAKMKGDK